MEIEIIEGQAGGQSQQIFIAGENQTAERKVYFHRHRSIRSETQCTSFPLKMRVLPCAVNTGMTTK